MAIAAVVALDPRPRHHGGHLRARGLHGHAGDGHRRPDDPGVLALRHGRGLRQGQGEHPGPGRLEPDDLQRGGQPGGEPDPGAVGQHLGDRAAAGRGDPLRRARLLGASARSRTCRWPCSSASRPAPTPRSSSPRRCSASSRSASRRCRRWPSGWPPARRRARACPRRSSRPHRRRRPRDRRRPRPTRTTDLALDDDADWPGSRPLPRRPAARAGRRRPGSRPGAASGGAQAASLRQEAALTVGASLDGVPRPAGPRRPRLPSARRRLQGHHAAAGRRRRLRRCRRRADRGPRGGHGRRRGRRRGPRVHPGGAGRVPPAAPGSSRSARRASSPPRPSRRATRSSTARRRSRSTPTRSRRVLGC